MLELRERTYCDVIAEHIAGDDISDFLNWEVIKYTMVHTPKPPAIWYLKGLPDWDKWKEAIAESTFGNPAPYPLYPQSSGNMIHTANHLARFLERTKCKLKNIDKVFEFGAGYGCMCRLIHNLGFTGEYAIMDLPVMIKIQRYYLTGLNIDYVTEAAKFTKQMASGNNLFIATWSLSEVPLSLREEILSAVCANVDYVLLAVGGYRHYDNDAYFEFFVKRNKSHRWYKFDIPYFTRIKSYYLFGERI